MAKMVIESSTLQGLADALRSVTGETRTYTPTEMIEAVTNIMETGTYVLVDEDGNEIPAVFVENETAFTATPNDIRIGKTAVTDSGVTEGTKEIPSYYTVAGYKLVTNGSAFTLTMNRYDYTELQAIICPFTSSLNESVAAEKVVIDDALYPVQSATSEAKVTIDHANKRVDFGVTNTSGGEYLIRYFSYKEVY